MTTGDKIHYLRTKLGLTLQELGDKVGVGASTVRKWETGYIKSLRTDKMQKLAAARSQAAFVYHGPRAGLAGAALFQEGRARDLQRQVLYIRLCAAANACRKSYQALLEMPERSGPHKPRQRDLPEYLLR